MIQVKKIDYLLEIDGHRVAVIIDGCPFVTLDMRSAVNQMSDDFQTIPDVDQGTPVYEGCTVDGDVETYTWKAKSNLWEEKTYTLICDDLRFRYQVKVKGKGAVDGIEYVSGHSDTEHKLSACEFQDAFYPCFSNFRTEEFTFRALGECKRWSCFFTPSMFCYSFRCEGLQRRLGLGLVAQKGEHNFHTFQLRRRGDFWLETDQHGHTKVDGEWTAPELIGFAAENDLDAMENYCRYYRVSGIAEPSTRTEIPKFWYGPMACGWREQEAYYYNKPSHDGRACETTYTNYMNDMHAVGLNPRVLIIDDAWQKNYALNDVNPDNFPDLRGFVEKQHKDGVKVMLWIKLFDAAGMGEEGTVRPDGWMEDGYPERTVDPSHPTSVKIIKEYVHRMLSGEDGCYNCDGLKIDFESYNPRGRKFKTYSGKYGAELLYDYFKLIYDEAKATKPEAIINCSACHPYFNHLVDQCRLHDYGESNHNCREDRIARANLFRIAIPDGLIDTDTSGFGTNRDNIRALMAQPKIGVPDLYCLSSPGWFAFTEQEIETVVRAWNEYMTDIDRRYPKE